jgi:hypothetical protein
LSCAQVVVLFLSLILKLTATLAVATLIARSVLSFIVRALHRCVSSELFQARNESYPLQTS